MDKQKVLELARQSGMLVGDDRARSRGLEGATIEDLLAFAELVAKAERERLYQEALARGIQAVKSSGEILAEAGEIFRAERSKLEIGEAELQEARLKLSGRD